MGSGKSSLDNSQWRPNKRMAGIPRARSSRVAPAQASLGPCDSRVARASRLSPRARVSAPRAARRTPAPSFARRARSPRSIAAFDRRRARRFAAQHLCFLGPEQKERNSTDRRVGKDDGERQKTPPPWSRAVRRCAWERGVDTPLGVRARDERRGARDYDTKRRDDDARAEFEISIGARGCATMTRSGSRSSGRGTRQGAKD